jgi:hypothetical protein
MPRQTVTGRPNNAESLAVEALAFIAADAERLARFLALTGIGPDNVRVAARDSGFLAAVLDYLAADDALLLAFAEQAGRNPAAVSRACAALRGPDWERDTA